jgi:hypothetical protein
MTSRHGMALRAPRSTRLVFMFGVARPAIEQQVAVTRMPSARAGREVRGTSVPSRDRHDRLTLRQVGAAAHRGSTAWQVSGRMWIVPDSLALPCGC